MRLGQIAAEALETMTARRLPVENMDQVAGLIVAKIQEGKQHAVIRTLASEILTPRAGGTWMVPPKDWEKEVNALFNFVQERIRYTRDVTNLDTYHRAIRVLQLRMGDCDDMVILLGSLLQSVGYPVLLKIVDTTESPEGYNHIYLLVGLPPTAPSQWIALDPTVRHKAGWEVAESNIRDSLLYQV